ncbi:MAG: hypothetical protein AAGN35_01015 [Bacteroidota bacterium]
MRRTHWLTGLLLLSLAWGCRPPDRTVYPAFYHWKASFQPTAAEWKLLAATETQRLYLRYFDVDWSPARQEVVPIAPTKMTAAPPEGLEIVPTVYLTNRSLYNTPSAQIGSLAGSIAGLLRQKVKPTIWSQVREIQIDCDWSGRTRERYFQLLDTLRAALAPKQLSVTIRLHQLKYAAKTGIPPADRGMLMYYNMGDLDDPEEVNSILDLVEGERYLRDFRGYPLPLDVALPIFSWGVVRRRGRPVRLLNGLRTAEAERARGLEKIRPNHFKVAESRYFRDEYLYRGDQIRIESVSDSSLLAAAKRLGSTLDGEARHVALYHLDSSTIGYYDLETFTAVWDAFR